MKSYLLGGLIVAGVLMTSVQSSAHHSFAAEFDRGKPIKLTGIVTKIEWTNPHVWFYFNVKDPASGQVTNWGAEMGPPHGLQRQGWRRDTLKAGEEVTVGEERQRIGRVPGCVQDPDRCRAEVEGHAAGETPCRTLQR